MIRVRGRRKEDRRQGTDHVRLGTKGREKRNRDFRQETEDRKQRTET